MSQRETNIARAGEGYNPGSREFADDCWRESLLALILRTTMLLGTLVYLPSLYLSVVGGYWGIALADSIAIGLVFALYFYSRLSYTARAFGFSLILYMLGTVLLTTVGPVSQIYLFGFSILTTLLLGLRAGLVGVTINGVTLLSIGLAGVGASTMSAAVMEDGPMTWVVLTLNFMLVNTLLVLALGAVIARLENALARQQQARETAEESTEALRQANEALEREIEERTRTEEALATSAERFRLLSRATTDAIWDWDLAANSLWWNEGFATLFGIREDEASDAASWSTRIHPEDHDRVVNSIHAVIDGEGEQWEDEYRFQRSDGSYATVMDRGHVIRNSEGKAVRMIGGMTDLTERKKLEQQFLRAQRMESIGTLAGGIAHDLNNILAPILMATELLPDHVRDEAGREMLASVRSSAQRGADLVKQVLGFARGIEGVRRTVNPLEIVREIHHVARDTFPRNIDIELTAQEGLRTVLADPTQLHQVVMNLCVNARDAMPEGGKLTIALENLDVDDIFADINLGAKAGPYVLIRIEDTGTGMPLEIQEKIFEPFFTTKELGKGTGLGLSTTFSIVRDHGGFIGLYSEPGRGARFKIHLPAVSAEADPGRDNGRADLPRGDGELVMVVDDEETIREVTGKALELFGYRVMHACNGAEAVSLYLQHRDTIAVVLTDMSMPVMDGAAMIGALRSINPKVNIIASSGLSEISHTARNNDREKIHFVPKPYTAEVLLTTLRVVLPQNVFDTEDSTE
jgi:PAS domain S-box-containing protein